MPLNDFQKNPPGSEHGTEIPAVETDNPSTFRGTQFRSPKLVTQGADLMSKIADLH